MEKREEESQRGKAALKANKMNNKEVKNETKLPGKKKLLMVGSGLKNKQVTSRQHGSFKIIKSNSVTPSKES